MVSTAMLIYQRVGLATTDLVCVFHVVIFSTSCPNVKYHENVDMSSRKLHLPTENRETKQTNHLSAAFSQACCHRWVFFDGKAQPLLYIYTHLQKCGCKIVFQNCMTMCGVSVSLCFCVCVRGSGCQIPGFIAYIPVSIYYIPVFIDIHWLYPNIRGFYLGFNVD